jgi:hypothetical protein
MSHWVLPVTPSIDEIDIAKEITGDVDDRASCADDVHMKAQDEDALVMDENPCEPYEGSLIQTHTNNGPSFSGSIDLHRSGTASQYCLKTPACITLPWCGDIALY